MRGEFDDDELEPVLLRRDTELTLGPKFLVAMFSGLVLLCALFFGLGYAVGHRATPAASTLTSAPVKPKDAQQDSAKPKPSATTAGKGAKLAAQIAAPSADPQAISPAVQPADADRRGHDSSGHPASTFSQSASAGLMVQIAAVSHQEDAEVLQGALRKRGYAVTVRREDADSLLHVRIGPFKSRDEADRWRQKLLSDGYNATVQP
jgi:cell division septation protein DedD